MNLAYLGKAIVAAVAQRPFLNGINTFCKLIPVFDHRSDADGVLSEDDFFNDGEIWWKLSSAYSQNIVPGMLMELTLERSPGADETRPEVSLYQARFDGREEVLGNRCGAEVLNLDWWNEKSLFALKGGGGSIEFPHVPSRIVYLRVAGFVYGPFSTETKEIVNGCRAKTLVRPFREGLKVFKISDASFSGRYRILSSAKEVSLDQEKRSDSVNVETVSWMFLPPAECQKIEGDFNLLWEELDFEPFSAKLARIVRSVEGFTRADRQNVNRLVERLEQAVFRVEDPAKIKAAISGISSLTESAEQSVRDIARILTENGLLNEDRLEQAKQSYLEKWIDTQTEQINSAIAEKQHDLDMLILKEEDEKAKFELEANRRKKELQDEIDRELSDIESLKRKALVEIESERSHWNEERDRLKGAFDDKEQKISSMIQTLQNSMEEQSAEIIRLYPFLKNLSCIEKVGESDRERGDATKEPERFQIPQILQNGCGGAKISLDQNIFMEQLVGYTRDCGFFYDPNDLRRFHTSVLCEGVTVLAGPSGVGKSSLARLYGEVLSGKEEEPRNGTHIIHVSPTWMERSDMLGYVNTVTGEFSPSETGLYQRLIYAAEDYRINAGDSALYPICLDEMNLSQIEHYFNDFMQLLEQPAHNRILPCFSRDAVKADSKFVDFASVQLAPSLRFIGTVNFDETTRRMSMRFLDRVNLIHLSDTESASPKISGVKAIHGGHRGVSFATYSSWNRKENLTPGAEKCLADLNPHLRCLGTAVSPRVREGMKRYIASSIPLIAAENGEQIAFDEQIAQRVLSRIRSLTSSRQEEALEEVERILSDYCGTGMTQSRKLIEALRNQHHPFGFGREDED